MLINVGILPIYFFKERMIKDNYEIIQVEDFSFLYFSDIGRIEGKAVFDRDDISQKFIFTLMDICHRHGFGCSSPQFTKNDDMIFFIGATVPSKRSLKKYSQLLYGCMLDIEMFSYEFYEQLDFSVIDLTMFRGSDIYDFSPTQMAAIRDQHFKGSWNAFKKTLIREDRIEEADMIDRCKKFEKINKKDIGFVGHRLNDIIEMVHSLEQSSIVN